MQQIIVVMGTDGSGKTTLAAELVARLRDDGLDVVREWLGAESYLMAPIRTALQMLWRGERRSVDSRHGTARQTYREEIQKKNEIATSHAWAVRGYLAAAMADYKLQLKYKLARSKSYDLVIADRYVFDVVVNLALTLGWDVDETITFAQRQMSRFPAVRLGVFVRVSPEVSMSRKDDIPDIDYLRLRQSYYEALAAAFGFIVFDGTQTIDDNVLRLRQLVATSLATPSVHYVHSNNEDVGGADMVLVSMARHMREQTSGYRTQVHLRLATRAAAAHAEVGTPVALSNFVRPQLKRGVYGVARLLLLGPGTVMHFWRIFGRERPDIVHVNDLYDFLPAIAARGRGIPVVFHLRMIKDGITCMVFSVVLPRLATATISVSEAVRRNYRFRHTPPAGHVVIHDLGNPQLVEISQDVGRPGPRPAGVPDRGRMVTMVGRLEKWKGQHVFLEAINRIPSSVRDGNTFVLVGGGVPGKLDYAVVIEQEATRLGVKCLGVRTDVPSILLASDISVHCSIEPDPFPGVVIESLLAGAATVAARDGGVLEMIDDETVGLTYTPGDFVQLAEIITNLLVAPDPPRMKYAAIGRARALALVSADVVDAHVTSVYQSLIGPARRPDLARNVHPHKRRSRRDAQ